MWRLSHPSNAAARILALLVAGGVGVYGIGLLLPNIAAILVGTPGVTIKGEFFIGNHVVVVRDVNGSMQGTEADLNGQIDKLKSSGMTIEVRSAQGFGVNKAGSQANLFHQIEEALKSTPNLDTIYAFSDFEVVDSSAWESGRTGYVQLKALLTRHRVRLYLGTARHPPSIELAVIARESGGGLIE